MAMTDVFFTPSILITLAICLILISALGLFFIQKLNQQNHKLNTMFDIVNTLAKETNEIKYHLFTGENAELGEQTGGIDTKNDFPSAVDDPSMVQQHNDDESHTINMIDISTDDDSDDESDDDEEEEEKDGYAEDDESGEEDDDDEDDDEDDEDEDEDNDDDDEDDDDGDDDNDNKSELPTLEIDEELSSLPELESEVVETTQEDEGVKNLDIVLDYKKASLTKLREIVQSKGIVDDASKMKKADILKLLESE